MGGRGTVIREFQDPRNAQVKSEYVLFKFPLEKSNYSFCPFSAMVKGISIKTGAERGATKTDGDVFAIIETTGKECMTGLLTNDKGVDRSSLGKVDHYSSEDRIGSRVRKNRALWIARERIFSNWLHIFILPCLSG